MTLAKAPDSGLSVRLESPSFQPSFFPRMNSPSGSPAPEPPESFLPPSAEALSAMLPQYEISHLIASGGMGAVYAGIQRALDRPVAVKILPPDAARDHESIGRFRTEAKAMARLIHPNIPAVYDFDVSSGYCYLVMEFIDGCTVHQLISHKELNPELTFRLVSQVCDALQFAHQRGIVHGDIKPSNLLVTQDGIVKLADFGLAQLTGAGAAQAESYAPMGTPEYAAPELWQAGAAMDHRADLYSLGCVFYEMLTGSIPQGKFDLPAKALGLDPLVDQIIVRCMQQKPDLRYQSALGIKNDLETLQQSPAATPMLAPPIKVLRRTARPQGKRSPVKKPARPPRLLLWLLPVAALGAGAWFILRSSDTPAPTALSPATPETGPMPTVLPAPPAPAAALPPGPAQAAPTVPLPAAGPALSPATAEKITALLTTYRSDWKSRVTDKVGPEHERLGKLYLAALTKLQAEFTQAADAPTALAVQTEITRFARDPSGLAGSSLSSNEKLATLQKTLTAALAKAQAIVKPAASQLHEQCLLAFKKIEDSAPENEQAILALLYDKIVKAPDLAGVVLPE